MIYYDASSQRLGIVLMQHGRVITYSYRQLEDYEKNHPTHDLELVVVVFALKIYRGITCMVYIMIYILIIRI